MTAENIISLIGAVTGLILAVWGIVKYYDVKRTKKEEKNKEAEKIQKQQEQKLLNKTISETVSTLIEPLRMANEKQEESIAEIKEQMEESDKDRLRTAIMDFGNKLRNNYIVSDRDFERVHDCYDKYVAKGGNSYVHAEMDYIIAEEQKHKTKQETIRE